jgi:ubiquinone/menaquinone biosynthesis C-methylase UbiE
MPERMTWLPPPEVILVLGLKAGESVADIGAGTGYFTLPMAKAVGSSGRVYAVDAQPEMLEFLRQKLDAGANSNVELIHAEADSTKLPDASCDLVFLANVWHEFDDRQAVLREARRLLKNSGRIAILDWRPDVEPEHGPPLALRFTAESAVAELAAAGFGGQSQRDIGKYSWLVQAQAEAIRGTPR